MKQILMPLAAAISFLAVLMFALAIWTSSDTSFAGKCGFTGFLAVVVCFIVFMIAVEAD